MALPLADRPPLTIASIAATVCSCSCNNNLELEIGYYKAKRSANEQVVVVVVVAVMALKVQTNYPVQSSKCYCWLMLANAGQYLR